MINQNNSDVEWWQTLMSSPDTCTYRIEMSGDFTSSSRLVWVSLFLGTCREEKQIKNVGYQVFLKTSSRYCSSILAHRLLCSNWLYHIYKHGLTTSQLTWMGRWELKYRYWLVSVGFFIPRPPGDPSFSHGLDMQSRKGKVLILSSSLVNLMVGFCPFLDDRECIIQPHVLSFWAECCWIQKSLSKNSIYKLPITAETRFPIAGPSLC